MSKNSQNLPDCELPAAESRVSQLQPPAVMAALGYPVRWDSVHLLADGQPRSITDIAAVVGGLPDTVSKQLWVLQRAGVLDWYAGEDRRQTLFFLPAAYCKNPGVVDFGFCQLQFPDVVPHDQN